MDMQSDLNGRNLLNALEYLRRAIGKPRLEVQQMQLLLLLSLYPEGIAMQNAARELDVDPSLVSRNVKAFGPAGDGPHLIQQQIDFQNPRQRLVTLTPEGHKILKMLHEVSAGTKKAPELPPVLDKRKLGQ